MILVFYKKNLIMTCLSNLIKVKFFILDRIGYMAFEMRSLLLHNQIVQNLDKISIS